MAVTWVGAGALAVNNTTNSQAIAQPTCAVGDILVAFVINKALGNAIQAPDGTWTQIYQADADCTDAADDHRAAVFWKIATATTGNHTFTKTTDDNLLFGGVIGAWHGQSLTNPIDATTPVGQANAAAADNVTFPAFDPTATNAHIIFAAFYGNDLTTFGAAMSSDTNPDCTKRIDLETSTGNDASIAVCDGDTTDGANIASRTWASSSTTDAGSTAVVFGLIPEASPTIALNTPADTANVADTTPALDFTGTDVNTDTLEYNVQVDTVNTFDSQTSSGPVHDATVKGSANGSNSWTLPALSTAGTNRLVIVMTHTSNTSDAVPSSANLTFVKIGSSFTFSGNGQMQVYRAFASAQLSSEVITITGTGFPQVTAVASTFSNTDTTGTSGSGAIGATNTVNSGSSTTASAAVTTTRGNSLVIGCFAETANFVITAGTAQTQLDEATGVAFSRSEIEKQDAITASASTSVTNNVGYGGTCACGGMVIELLTPAPTPLIDKLSVSDTGFADVTDGADTHPFDSGDQIEYTVQSALNIGTTYYWRARAIDPLGSNTYSSWATTRSFTVISGNFPKPNILLQAVKRSNFF